MRTVQVRGAKATFSALVEAAERGEPTTITRHGKAAAMVVPMDVARRLYPDDKPSFADFLMSFPGLSEDFARDLAPTRSVDL